MKRLMVAVLMAVAFAAVFAAGTGVGLKGGVAFAADEIRAAGVVQSVDAEKGIIVIMTRGADEPLTLSAGADMLKGLKKGDKVKIRYTSGEKNTATYLKKLGPIVVVGC